MKIKVEHFQELGTKSSFAFTFAFDNHGNRFQELGTKSSVAFTFDNHGNHLHELGTILIIKVDHLQELGTVLARVGERMTEKELLAMVAEVSIWPVFFILFFF